VLGRKIDNAVEFTDEGKIVLGARSLAQGIELWVEDAGIGSEATDLERIFGGFHQVNDENHLRSLGVLKS
jgi:signal transduction histidine kinase